HTPHSERNPVSPANLQDYIAQNHSFVGISGYAYYEMNFTDGGTPERVSGNRIDANFFSVLGAQPALGRTFTAEEDRDGGPRAVILTDRLWRRRFHAEPAVLGTTISLDASPHTVVGILS